MKWIPYGPDAWLLQFAERVGDKAFQRGRAIAAELDRRPPPGLVEYVPAFTTVLLEFSPGHGAAEELASLGSRLKKVLGVKVPASKPKSIPVIYDGPDLERVAKRNKLSVEEVCRRHAAVVYKVYALGFSPGFPYLGDLDPRLHTPRLASPRPRVLAGSVAIGGEHTGIYSVESPGGWNIIGRTTVKLFDPSAAEAGVSPGRVFFLEPGDRVKFIRALDVDRERSR